MVEERIYRKRSGKVKKIKNEEQRKKRGSGIPEG